MTWCALTLTVTLVWPAGALSECQEPPTAVYAMEDWYASAPEPEVRLVGYLRKREPERGPGWRPSLSPTPESCRYTYRN
jgi:hypothetical protein